MYHKDSPHVYTCRNQGISNKNEPHIPVSNFWDVQNQRNNELAYESSLRKLRDYQNGWVD